MLEFTGLKFKDGTEVKSGEQCFLIEKQSNKTVFIGVALGSGLFRGHLSDAEGMVPANMMRDTHYLKKA